MTRIAGKVLVASDLGRGSDEAIRQAAVIARDSEVALVACIVLPEMFRVRPLFPHLREMDREEAEKVRRMAASALEKQLGRVLGSGAPRPEVRLDAGSAHWTVLKIANEIKAGLIVIGYRADKHGILGGVGERVARHADCPVLIASGNRGNAVLAATDFSDQSLPAVRLGREEADRRGLPLSIVHVIDLQASKLDLPEIVSASLIERVMEARREEARGRLADLAKELGAGPQLVLREGSEIDEILAVADDLRAELIVMGTHGRSGLGRMAFGSVAEGVMRRAKTSKLIVRLGT